MTALPFSRSSAQPSSGSDPRATAAGSQPVPTLPDPQDRDDAILEFATESELARNPRGVLPPPKRTIALWAATAVVLLALVVAGYPQLRHAFSAQGSLRVESDPPGAMVRIDGAERGRTPLTLALPAGSHEMVLHYGNSSKTIPLTIERSIQTVHHVAWASERAPATSTAMGRLQIVSEPAGAAVTVDGVSRGTAPLLLDDVSPGPHQVVVRSGGATTQRTVMVEAGATASLVISGAAAGAVSGWMSVPSPVSLRVYEGGRLIGTTDAERIMLPVGDHQLEFAADALGFRITRNVRITAGQTTKVAVPLVEAPLSVNAIPWAEVWLDGVSIGETPIGNLTETIGPHVLEFRHPQFGRKQLTVQVSLKEPTRISVDMRTP